MNSDYGEVFRDAFALLHSGRGEGADGAPRIAGEGIEEYLARTRMEALGVARKQLLAAQPPEELGEAHNLLVELLSNALQADEALAEQVKAYQCGQFHESIAYSERLQQLVVESQRLDRELIMALRALAPELREEIGLSAELAEGSA